MPHLHRFLGARQREYKQGDGEALLLALAVWLECCKGPPTWIADGFWAAWRKWDAYEVTTLDAAFDVQPRTEKQRKKLHEWNALRSRILAQIEQARRRGIPVDIRLFERIGADIGRSGAFVSRVYYDEASAPWRELLRRIRPARGIV
ncbi:MAG TPA: hypothetical protein VKF40_04540 [Burkholderiales bacterium]|nr:hypothetical protein [Burkholderiales bacterium]